MNNLKLGVEVVSASDLAAKDGQTSNSFVELSFDGQRYRTSVKEQDLNPVWNERFYFNITDPTALLQLALEASVYSVRKNSPTSKSFLGKVRIAGTSFVPFPDAAVMHYPLDKRSMFSRVKGGLGLKVYITDDPSLRPSNPLPAIDHFPSNPPPPAATHASYFNLQTHFPEKQKQKQKAEDKPRHTFRSIPKEGKDKDVKSDPPPPPPPAATAAAVKDTVETVTETVKLATAEMKLEPPRVVNMYSAGPLPPPPYHHHNVDYNVKEIASPGLGMARAQVIGGQVVRPPAERPSSTYNLVEQMQYLFIRVVKARDLPNMDITGSLDPYVELKIGNHRGKTKVVEKKRDPVWNEVFAFSGERLQSSVLEVLVKDKDLVKDDFVGIVRFDLHEVPTRVPPDSPLAPEWYRIVDKKGEKLDKGEVMLAVWMGTQADECFPEAWHPDAIATGDTSVPAQHVRSKVYHAPRLWYVRVNIIEAQDVVIPDKNRYPDVSVKVQLGHQMFKTKQVQSRTPAHFWNEELMFVAAEPFEDHLVISLEDRVGPSKEEVIGRVAIHLGAVEKRLDDRPVNPCWYRLDKSATTDGEKKDSQFACRLHVRVCLEGGYHVLDESTHYSSDLRPSAKQLWRPSIGVLELGILGADGLIPVKARGGRGTCDAYCVARYGQKWVRTRTVVNSLCPRFNEQYTWEVYDPATVLTVGVFDNCHITDGGDKSSSGNRDEKIGKIRIRLSTLSAGRVYTNSYPLITLHPSGVKKMGELQLAVRFSSASFFETISLYSRPLLPKMHYVRPLSMMQQDLLRRQAVGLVASRLGRMEPPLRREVVDYMCDMDSHMWSMRKSKANFFRLVSVFGGLIELAKWFETICSWRKPLVTVLMHMLLLILACYPDFILPTVCLYVFWVGARNYWYRPQHPPHMDVRISHAEIINPDEFDEEFDPFPSSRSPDTIRSRYDRLRFLAGRVQAVAGDIATQGERFQALISWRDPRATMIFLFFLLWSALLFYVTPIQVLGVLVFFYLMRHPKFRNRMPSGPVNFFRRLPARTDSML